MLQIVPRLLLAAFAVAVAPVLVFAQNTMSVDPEPEPLSRPRATMTAEQVLEKYVEATGGLAARAKLSTFVAKGTIEYVGSPVSGTIEIYAKAPNRYLEVVTIRSAGSLMTGYDGVTGWMKDPRAGSRVLTGVELAAIKRTAAFNGDVEWQKQYKSASVVSVEGFSGQDYYILEFVPFGPDEAVQRRYYNADTFLLTRVEASAGNVRGGEFMTITLSDYRRVNGVLVPFGSESRLSRSTLKVTLESVTFNAPVALSKFRKP